MQIVNNWLKIVQRMVRSRLESAQRCLLCLSLSHRPIPLCVACEPLLPWLGQGCQRCALPMLSVQSGCPACQHGVLPYDGLQALFDYAWPLNAFISLLKYQGHLHYARLLSFLMAEKLTPVYPVDCIVPVPLHPQRQQQRGFNQTRELAKPLAKKLGVPLEQGLCWRKTHNVPQSSLRAKKRSTNVSAQSFVIDRAFTAKHVLIVEDVVTTGATVNAFSTALKSQGVKTVEIWACCRTILDKERFTNKI